MFGKIVKSRTLQLVCLGLLGLWLPQQAAAFGFGEALKTIKVVAIDAEHKHARRQSERLNQLVKAPHSKEKIAQIIAIMLDDENRLVVRDHAMGNLRKLGDKGHPGMVILTDYIKEQMESPPLARYNELPLGIDRCIMVLVKQKSRLNQYLPLMVELFDKGYINCRIALKEFAQLGPRAGVATGLITNLLGKPAKTLARKVDKELLARTLYSISKEAFDSYFCDLLNNNSDPNVVLEGLDLLRKMGILANNTIACMYQLFDSEGVSLDFKKHNFGQQHGPQNLFVIIQRAINYTLAATDVYNVKYIEHHIDMLQTPEWEAYRNYIVEIGDPAIAPMIDAVELNPGHIVLIVRLLDALSKIDSGREFARDMVAKLRSNSDYRHYAKRLHVLSKELNAEYSGGGSKDAD